MNVTNWIARNYESESRIRRATARYVWITRAWFAAAALTLVPVLVGYGVLHWLGVTVSDTAVVLGWPALTLLLYGRFDQRMRERVEQRRSGRRQPDRR